MSRTKTQGLEGSKKYLGGELDYLSSSLHGTLRDVLAQMKTFLLVEKGCHIRHGWLLSSSSLLLALLSIGMSFQKSCIDSPRIYPEE